MWRSHTMLHSWDVTSAEALAIQRRFAPYVRQAETIHLEQVHTVAGIDASYREIGRAVVAVFSFPDLQLIDQAVATRVSTFPYVPGLLSFREGPIVLAAMERLRSRPDLLLFDGQGYAHPRRFGLASHMGLYLDRPSIGCAKSRLTGTYAEPGPHIGDRAPLVDAGETIGMVLRTKPRTNPLFISTGYKVDLDTAVDVVLRCLRGYRLPEPTRIADRLSKAPSSDGDGAPSIHGS
jgi:deoxyribonuclease V